MTTSIRAVQMLKLPWHSVRYVCLSLPRMMSLLLHPAEIVACRFGPCISDVDSENTTDDDNNRGSGLRSQESCSHEYGADRTGDGWIVESSQFLAGRWGLRARCHDYNFQCWPCCSAQHSMTFGKNKDTYATPNLQSRDAQRSSEGCSDPG